MSRGERKFIIELGVVLALWRIVEVPAVQHAFLQFLAVGEVPGMAQPLSPKGVYLLLATIFSLSLILIFRKELLRSIGWHRAYVSDARTAGAYTQAKDVTKVASISAEGEQRLSGDVIILRSRQGVKTSSTMPKLRLGDKVLPSLYVPPIMPAIWRLMDLEMSLIAATYRHVRIFIECTWRYTRQLAIRTWRWLEPRIRYLDKQIEKQVRSNSTAAEILEIAKECWRATSGPRRRTDGRRIH